VTNTKIEINVSGAQAHFSRTPLLFKLIWHK